MFFTIVRNVGQNKMRKIKLPITDQFLWSLYDFFEKLDRLYEPFAPRTTREAFDSEYYHLWREWERKLSRRRFSKLVYYLKKKGWIKVKVLEGKKAILLTPKGVQKITKLKYKKLKKKKRKDGRWEMVIFDIPETKRQKRDSLRELLKLLGYSQLQKSIWVSPYDVLEETQKIIINLKLEKHVRLLLIEEVPT